jgi:hypothetical protein
MATAITFNVRLLLLQRLLPSCGRRQLRRRQWRHSSSWPRRRLQQLQRSLHPKHTHSQVKRSSSHAQQHAYTNHMCMSGTMACPA